MVFLILSLKFFFILENKKTFAVRVCNKKHKSINRVECAWQIVEKAFIVTFICATFFSFFFILYL